jgi:hypothetical protein
MIYLDTKILNIKSGVGICVTDGAARLTLELTL